MKPRYQDREWLLILLPLLLGGICLQGVARAATRLPSLWTASTNMYSKLDPDESYEVQWRMIVEPLRPEIMTPPVWSPGTSLTPEKKGKGLVVSPASFGPTRTSTPGPGGTDRGPSTPGVDVTETPRVPASTQPIASPTPTPPPTSPTPALLPTQPTASPTPTPLPTQPTASPTLAPSPTPPQSTEPPKPTKEPKPTNEPKPTKEPKPPDEAKPTKEPKSTKKP